MDNNYTYIQGLDIQQQKKDLLSQLRRSDVENNKIIEAMSKVPREEFIPQDFRRYAYENRPLLIGYEQTISSPDMVVYMLDVAELTKHSNVLEIGTGSGYQTAILSFLCNKVFSIELIPELANSAKKLLKKLGYYTDNNNIEIQVGNGYSTKYKDNSFDVILVTAAPSLVPEHLKNLLKVNGKLIIPVGSESYSQELLRITKHSRSKFIKEKLLDVRFVPMLNK